MSERLDCVVIGAGVIGLAVARALALRGREVIVLEAAGAIGTETSSRNSEVIHGGLYYPTGSLKARTCVRGRDLLYAYCAERSIPHRRLGKLIVATTPEEIPQLAQYRERAARNGAGDLEPLDAAEVRRREPEVRCVAALWSPLTGIIDSHAYMLALQADLEAHGGTVVLRSPVTGGRLGGAAIALEVDAGEAFRCEARTVVNCAGLVAPAVSASLAGYPAAALPPQRYAKGHYYTYGGRPPFRHLVYPLANNAGLGVHVTLDLAGQARFGPDVAWIDRPDYGFDDSRREAFIEAIRRYYPALDAERLQPGYTGIRPKITGPDEPAADFAVHGPEVHAQPGLVCLYGIESPGLTASLALAEHVAGRCA